MLVPAEAWPVWAQPEPWPIGRLIPYARNARTHSKRQVREIAGLIAQFGWTFAILVDVDGTIIAGHGRVLAAELLRLAEVPVIVARGWSEAQIRAYCVADNKVAENAGWDKELLALELAALANMPEIGPLADLGFTTAELTRLLPDAVREGHSDPDAEAAPAAGVRVVSRPGDIWLLGGHRLMCGDSTNADHVAALLGVNKPHLMVTDQPYGVELDPSWREQTTWQQGHQTAAGQRAVGEVANDDRVDWREAFALFPGDVAYVWHASWFVSDAQAALEAVGFKMRAQVIWAKKNFVISRGDYHWRHEPCWYAVRKGAIGHWQGSRSETTLWDDIEHRKSDTGHGTQKPIECMLRPIRNNSKAGDYVYEPFNGSGTTIIAGEMLGRRVLAMELMPAYVDIAVKRWEGFTKKTAILAAGDMAWGEVAAARLAEAA